MGLVILWGDRIKLGGCVVASISQAKSSCFGIRSDSNSSNDGGLWLCCGLIYGREARPSSMS